MDIPCAPILADITVNGRTVKAVAQPTKQAFLYVFDRETGEPIWPIDEQPVRRATCRASGIRRRSRSRPSRRPTIARASSIDDLIDFTPELRAEAVKLASQYKIGPMFTPPVVSKCEGPLATLILPPQPAATNWPGGSYDPETHIALRRSRRRRRPRLGLVPPAERRKSDMNYISGQARDPQHARRAAPGPAVAAAAGGERRRGLTVQGLPLHQAALRPHHRASI